MRPFGVTVLSVFLIAVGMLSIVGGTSLILTHEQVAPIILKEYGDFLNETMEGAPVPLTEDVLKSMLFALSVLVIVLGMIYFAIGLGLWWLKNWARIAAVFLSGLNVVYGLFVVFINPFALIEIIINVLIIWYLMRKDVREAFGRKLSIEERVLGNYE
jgi:uncharacterized membrane protein (DUF2068 family)